MGAADRGPSSFAEELNRLCARRWPGGARSANVDIADFVSRQTGRSIDRQYIWRIRKGHVAKVDSDVRDAICRFFGVTLDHFSRVDDDDFEDRQLRDAMRESGLTIAGLRSSELSEEGRRELERLVNQAATLLRQEQRK